MDPMPESFSVHTEYDLFRVPGLESEKSEQLVVGLVDASGSMGSYWVEMVKFWNKSVAPVCSFLVTFSAHARVEPRMELSENLKAHGGGCTNILEAFEQLEQYLSTLPKDKSVTVIFISDGADTVHNRRLPDKLAQLQGSRGLAINFVCLGIQKGFPTKVSLVLREKYHSGDDSVPALYLIEFASEKAFFNKFETIQHLFGARARGLLNEFVDYRRNPWEPQATERTLTEGKWILLHKEFPALHLTYPSGTRKELTVPPLSSLSIEDLVDCFRGWVQLVQIESMDKAKSKQAAAWAQAAVDAARGYVLEYEAMNNISLISEPKVEAKESFKSRAAKMQARTVGSRISWFIDELTVLSKGMGLGQLSEYDAAKRMGIGTITGKYHQKALALKGLTPKAFREMCAEFREVFLATELSAASSSQDASVFTLQNQKEVFQEEDLLEGLDLCNSQFDFVESFPVVGYSLKVKRYDGSLVNPWKVTVQSLAHTHNSIDSAYLARNQNSYSLSTGLGKVEEINAVLPLFGPDDIEMAPLLNSRLFKLAISFMAVQNIDTYHADAYLALLANTFVYIIGLPHSGWRAKMLSLIHSSINVTFNQTPEFRRLVESIRKTPFALFRPEAGEEHVDIAKVLLIVFFLHPPPDSNPELQAPATVEPIPEPIPAEPTRAEPIPAEPTPAEVEEDK